MNNIIQGSSWCVKCDKFSKFELTGYNEPCTHCAGVNWEVVPGQVCTCGEPKRWMHQPPPEPLEYAFTLELKQPVHVHST